MPKLAGGGNLDVGEPNLPTYTQPDIVGDLHISGKLYINDTEYVPGQTAAGNWAAADHNHNDRYAKLKPLEDYDGHTINNPIGQTGTTVNGLLTLDQLLHQILNVTDSTALVQWTSPTLTAALTFPSSTHSGTLYPNTRFAFDPVPTDAMSVTFTITPGSVANAYDANGALPNPAYLFNELSHHQGGDTDTSIARDVNSIDPLDFKGSVLRFSSRIAHSQFPPPTSQNWNTGRFVDSTSTYFTTRKFNDYQQWQNEHGEADDAGSYATAPPQRSQHGYALNTSVAFGQVRFKHEPTMTNVNTPTADHTQITNPANSVTITFGIEVTNDVTAWPCTWYQSANHYWLPQGNHWNMFHAPLNQVVAEYELLDAVNGSVHLHHSTTSPSVGATEIVDSQSNTNAQVTQGGTYPSTSQHTQFGYTLPLPSLKFRVAMPFYLIDNDPTYYCIDGSKPQNGWRWHPKHVESLNGPLSPDATYYPTTRAMDTTTEGASNLIQQFVFSAYGSTGYWNRNSFAYTLYRAIGHDTSTPPSGWDGVTDGSATVYNELIDYNGLHWSTNGQASGLPGDMPLIDDSDGTVRSDKAEWLSRNMYIHTDTRVEFIAHHDDTVASPGPISPSEKQAGIGNTPEVHFDTKYIELKLKASQVGHSYNGFKILWVPSKTADSSVVASHVVNHWKTPPMGFQKMWIARAGQNYYEATNKLSPPFALHERQPEHSWIQKRPRWGHSGTYSMMDFTTELGRPAHTGSGTGNNLNFSTVLIGDVPPPAQFSDSSKDCWVIHDVPNPVVWASYTGSRFWTELVQGWKDAYGGSGIHTYNGYGALVFTDQTPMGSLVWVENASEDMYVKFGWD